ncbi:ribosome recycling factor [Limihaloglobus sulfuriphilus]|nr:ribosome recycling factor [Limihaloglobus sulfuriphilus]
MTKTVQFLEDEFRGVRTGRASTGLVENMKIDYYGSMTPLKQMASLSIAEATQILIKPFDPSSVKNIEKAIKTSDLGLTPMADGGTIRLPIPPLSEERRQKIAAQLKQMAEQQKIAIRNIRRDANKQLDDEEKSKVITEDDRDKGKKDIDDMTKKYSDQIDNILKDKIKEVMEE